MAVNYEAESDRPRIFVSVAAYRDPECQWTLRDLFEKATYPERVFPGVVFQYLPDKDQHCFEFETRPEQVRMLKIHAMESKGACWARNLVQTLWQGEPYVFQIDSHMRFEPGWDETLIDMLAQCPSEKPVLTTYPPGYEPPDQLNPPAYCTLTVKGIDETGFVSLIASSSPISSAPEVPASNPFLSANFYFARAEFIHEVPYDPYLYFCGEEITLAVRAYTHGWDLFAPNKVVCYHLYGLRRPAHWGDHPTWNDLNKRALSRMRHVLGMEESTDPNVIAELDRFGLGHVRTLREYQQVSRVDFSRRSYLCRAFSHIFENKAWGTKETISGPGSTLASTRELRARLQELLSIMEVDSLLDLGCGDCNWIASLFPHLGLYIGIDVVPELVDMISRRYAHVNHAFFRCLDFTSDSLPQTDALLIRDCFTHFPSALVVSTLKQIARLRHKYVFISSYQRGENTDIAVGEWRPLDLLLPPFNLPPPRVKLPEADANKFLGLWRMDDLAFLRT